MKSPHSLDGWSVKDFTAAELMKKYSVTMLRERVYIFWGVWGCSCIMWWLVTSNTYFALNCFFFFKRCAACTAGQQTLLLPYSMLTPYYLARRVHPSTLRCTLRPCHPHDVVFPLVIMHVRSAATAAPKITVGVQGCMSVRYASLFVKGWRLFLVIYSMIRLFFMMRTRRLIIIKQDI